MSLYCFSFLPSKPAAEAIRSIIHNCYHHFWKTYGDVDDNEKERWFRLFEVTSNLYHNFYFISYAQLLYYTNFL